MPQTLGIGVPNALWTLFTVPEPDCPVVFRDSELPLMVATLRSSYGRHVGDVLLRERRESLWPPSHAVAMGAMGPI
ncbi:MULTISPECIES: hypothetical protein [unclassified Streptomyces]|uniref:hypothetical protein n=1 Tax=unclassified Streptomyces TaxID=2593676 RepID=UPI003866604F